MKHPTVREIATASGVSPATVTRALADSPLLSQATKAHVLETAREMGWMPNPLSSLYMSQLRASKKRRRTTTIAYLIPYRDTNEYVEYFKRHRKGSEERAASLGFELDVLWLRDFDYDMEKLAVYLRKESIPGLILNAGSLLPESFRGFTWEDFASASWGFSLNSPMLHQAAFYYMDGMRLLLRQLSEFGYKRVAMAISEDNDRLSDHTLLSAFSYEETHHSSDEWVKSYPLKSWHSNPVERKKIRKWLLANRPEVIIGETVAWEAIKEMGWRVPEDIAFASPNWSFLWSDIAGVDHMPEVIGAHSVELVVSQLTRNERGVPRNAKLLLNKGLWRDGKSVPRKNL